MALEILSGGVGVLFVIENDEIITCDFEEIFFYLIGINTCINCCYIVQHGEGNDSPFLLHII